MLRKWWWLLVLLVVLPLKGGERMPESQFLIYYGEATPAARAALRGYQLAIVEPNAWTKAQVQAAQKQTPLYGYVNVMEQEPAYALGGDAALLVAGKRVRNPSWDTYLLDLRQAQVQAALSQKVARIAQAGYHGVFLDTVGDIDDYLAAHPAVQAQQRAALVAWLRRMQKRYPQLVWMQNRGFATYQAATRPVVQSVLWEDFQAQAQRTDTWSQRWLRQLLKLDTHLLAVCADAESLRLARQLGMLVTYNSNDVYDRLP